MSHLRHIGLVVNNLEMEYNFYSQVFCFQEIDRKRESGNFIDTLVGLQHACIEWVKLKSPDGNNVAIEILKYISHPDEPHTNPVQRCGCSHLAMTVKNIEEIAKAIVDFGGWAGPIQQNPEGTVRVLYARDPEGIFLEIVEPC